MIFVYFAFFPATILLVSLMPLEIGTDIFRTLAAHRLPRHSRKISAIYIYSLPRVAILASSIK